MKPQTIDLLAMNDIREHPSVREKHAALQHAQRLHTDAEKAVTTARDERTAAEHAAATGRRDDRRLKTAHEGVTRAESELRIAKARLEDAHHALTQTMQGTSIEVERELIERHQDAVQRLDDALTIARDRSHDVTALENASSRLFFGGPYRVRDGLDGRPLREMSWLKEFGGPEGKGETRYGYWHQYIQRYVGKRA